MTDLLALGNFGGFTTKIIHF